MGNAKNKVRTMHMSCNILAIPVSMHHVDHGVIGRKKICFDRNWRYRLRMICTLMHMQIWTVFGNPLTSTRLTRCQKHATKKWKYRKEENNLLVVVSHRLRDICDWHEVGFSRIDSIRCTWSSSFAPCFHLCKSRISNSNCFVSFFFFSPSAVNVHSSLKFVLEISMKKISGICMFRSFNNNTPPLDRKEEKKMEWQCWQ